MPFDRPNGGSPGVESSRCESSAMASSVAASGRIKQILQEKGELRANLDTPVKTDHGNPKGARDGTNKWLTVKIKMTGTSKFNRASMRHGSLDRETKILE